MLLSPDQIYAFLGAAVLITVSPGPDNLMVLSLSLSRGRRQGMAFGLGCASGCLSHTLLAALGVSALIAASPLAFGALRVAGGAYLLYLGWQALRSRATVSAPDGRAGVDETPARLFARGLVANAVNPKVALFFLAFLPQFVDPARGATGWQLAQLGLLFTLQAALLFGLLGYGAGRVGGWLTRHPRGGSWLDRLAGTVFVALGLKLIVSVGS